MTRYGYILAVLASCAPRVPTPIPADVAACPAACAVLSEARCPEGKPSPGGIPCPQWCADYHQAGYMRPWAGCVAVVQAGDVEGVRACNVRCDR